MALPSGWYGVTRMPTITTHTTKPHESLPSAAQPPLTSLLRYCAKSALLENSSSPSSPSPSPSSSPPPLPAGLRGRHSVARSSRALQVCSSTDSAEAAAERPKGRPPAAAAGWLAVLLGCPAAAAALSLEEGISRRRACRREIGGGDEGKCDRKGGGGRGEEGGEERAFDETLHLK